MKAFIRRLLNPNKTIIVHRFVDPDFKSVAGQKDFRKHNSYMDFLVEHPDGRREFLSENELKKLGVL